MNVFFRALPIILLLASATEPVFAQQYNRADSLLGALTRYRYSYDVLHYDLELKLDPDLKRIAGSCTLTFRSLQDMYIMQVDLHQNFKIARILLDGKELTYRRDHHAVFVNLPHKLPSNQKHKLTVVYGGAPLPPGNRQRDGGIIWSMGPQKKPWIQATGALSGAYNWWPCKDHPSDKPDSVSLSVIVPEGLEVTANGILTEKKKMPGNYERVTWKTRYPISTRDVAFTVGAYTRHEAEYPLAGGKWKLVAYTLGAGKDLAEAYFSEVTENLLCLQQQFGEYPFDGEDIILSEAPMGLHNNRNLLFFKRSSREQTELNAGLAIIIARIWVGGSMTPADGADSWFREGLAAYAGISALACRAGAEQAQLMLEKWREDMPEYLALEGPQGVNHYPPNADMAHKSAWVFHTLRTLVADDVVWLEMLRTVLTDNVHRSIDTPTFLASVEKVLGDQYNWFFAPYLHDEQLPALELNAEKNGKRRVLAYRWYTEGDEFFLPVEIQMGNKSLELFPTGEWQSIPLRQAAVKNHPVNTRNKLFRVKEELY